MIQVAFARLGSGCKNYGGGGDQRWEIGARGRRAKRAKGWKGEMAPVSCTKQGTAAVRVAVLSKESVWANVKASRLSSSLASAYLPSTQNAAAHPSFPIPSSSATPSAVPGDPQSR
jgi:hypothetical protein